MKFVVRFPPKRRFETLESITIDVSHRGLFEFPGDSGDARTLTKIFKEKHCEHVQLCGRPTVTSTSDGKAPNSNVGFCPAEGGDFAGNGVGPKL